MNTALFFTFVLHVTIVTSQNPSEVFPHQAILDRNGNFQLYWKIEDVFITFEMHGRTTGWIGVGLSPNGGMIGADIFVGWVKNGEAFITDRHGQEFNGFSPLDPQQDLTLLGGSEENGWTRIKFRRQLSGCEADYDRTITTDTIRMIWAMGTTDPEDQLVASDYHGNGVDNRGTRSLLLLEASGDPSQLANVQTEGVELRSGNISLPAVATYYNCRLFELPNFSKKHHLIAVQPLIQSGNEAIVHHILLYQCRYTQPQDPSTVGQNHECSPNMPPDFQNCSSVIHGWAIGGGTLYYPEHVGFPLGTDDSPRYVLMETHYDNPGLRADIIDNSGFNLVYTDQLRQYDGGILEVGHTVFSVDPLIPPNTPSFLVHAECPGFCLQEKMIQSEITQINLVGTLLHSHLLGRKMTLRHLDSDNATELPYIAQDNSYDFNYQEVKLFRNEIPFTAGQGMQLVCDYDSTGRVNFSQGGLGTPQEMCLAYVFYYPKLPISRCESIPITFALFPVHFGAFIVNITNQRNRPTLNDITVYAINTEDYQPFGDFLNGLNLSSEQVAEYSRATQFVERTYICGSGQAARDITQGPAPNITSPYIPPIPRCIDTTDSPITTTSSGSGHFEFSLFLLVCLCAFKLMITC